MAVVENAAINVVGSSNPGRIVQKDVAVVVDRQSMTMKQNGVINQNFHVNQLQQEPQKGSLQVNGINGNGLLGNDHSVIEHEHEKMNGGDLRNGDDEGFKKEMRDLQEIFSKLNPKAEEFVPPSLANNNNMLVPFPPGAVQFNNFVMQTDQGVANGNSNRRKKNGYGYGRRRINTRTGMAQREDVIRRTVYVSEIDHQVTEEQLAGLFLSCGQVVDCRICGDTNSVLRFAFVEFTDEEGARSALSLAGTMLGFYPVRVLPSKTAIAPVNPTFLPRSEDEREMCARTVYCTNIDKKVTQADVKLFFETFCGEVHRLRLLGDYHHSTRIAFVEFVMAECAIAALNCSGAILGSLPIRVSPSKTPVRPRSPRSGLL
ncbi:polyadenylate-binding protein-interacting protein 11-like isoform X1 [Lycium barbarum]|uniref:polyadenylate-binding protein-interacting protein 11-like isoform X1 n=1 Tax=Lycium barbarum TaxID=112863 RepID=UPI00293F511A|nr:polyadenylate-binding protein-interacting protein 11-like isoform X1 [Lycium barbarum]